MSADRNHIKVEPSTAVQNVDFYRAVALCSPNNGYGYFPGPCPTGAQNTLLKENAKLSDAICDKNGTFILGKAYSVSLPSPVSGYGWVPLANAAGFCGSINELAKGYNLANPTHPVPLCYDRECVEGGGGHGTINEGGHTIDDMDWEVIAELGESMATGGKACSMNWPRGPVADGYSTPRPPATWFCPAGTNCSTTSIGGCNGSNGLSSGGVRKVLDRAQSVLASKGAQACLASGRLIARDADKKLRCYGTGRKGTPAARIDTVAARTAADCWNIGGALSGQDGKMVCLPNIAGLKGRKAAQGGERKN